MRAIVTMADGGGKKGKGKGKNKKKVDGGRDRDSDVGESKYLDLSYKAR